MDFIQTAQLRDLVISELTAVGARIKGEEALICCPWHDDSHPSLGVHIGSRVPPGTFHCFACSAKGGWNQLAAVLKLKTLGGMITQREVTTGEGGGVASAVEDLFKVLSKEVKRTPITEIIETPELKGIEPLPRNFNWRGLGRRFYEKFGGKLYWDHAHDINYLYFPLTTNGQPEGYTLCCLKAGVEPKYKIYGNAKKSFFLFDYVKDNEPVVLVEGHFDALKLQSEGIPAVAIFGVSNWGEEKRSLLMSKLPPKILLCFDGDKAGRDATTAIFYDLCKGSKVDVLHLPDDMDPGDISDPYLTQIHHWIG